MSACSYSEFCGAAVAERLVLPSQVEPADPYDDGELELLAVARPGLDHLALEAVDERLSQAVVIVSTEPTDAGPHDRTNWIYPHVGGRSV